MNIQFMRKLSVIIFCVICTISTLVAQIKVNGVVISANDGEPIIGATIIEKGTTLGTISDADGKFTIIVPSTSVLRISYVGMETVEENVKPVMRVVLSSTALSLDEVVVTALGMTREKKALGYAVGEIKGETKIGRASCRERV